MHLPTVEAALQRMLIQGIIHHYDINMYIDDYGDMVLNERFVSEFSKIVEELRGMVCPAKPELST